MASVSFIVPVFNKSSYLKTVISSLKKQKGNFMREFIFINDGSTDNSLKILKKETLGLKNSKIINQKNKGSANATNIGINLARMDYLKFLDADDILLSDATQKLVQLLEENPKYILAYGLQRKVPYIDTVDLNEKIPQSSITFLDTPIKLAMRNSMFNPSQFLVRRKICQQTDGCDERVGFSQEYSLTLRLSLLGSFIRLNYPITILPFRAPGQISENKNKQIFRVSKALELFVKDNSNLPLKFKLFAQRRLTARSWRFARNSLNSNILSKWFIYYLIGLLRLPFNILNTCIAANKVYKTKLD